jgi:hypothetical protein
VPILGSAVTGGRPGSGEGVQTRRKHAMSFEESDPPPETDKVPDWMNDKKYDAMRRELAAMPTDELKAELIAGVRALEEQMIERITIRGHLLLRRDDGDESLGIETLVEGCTGLVDRWVALGQLDGALAFLLDQDITRLRHVARLSLEDQVAWKATRRAPVVVDRRFGDYAVEMVNLEDLSARQLDQLIDADSLRSEEDQKSYLESLPRRPRKRPRRPGPRRLR